METASTRVQALPSPWPTRAAHEQRHAEPFLERLYLMADGGLGNVKLFGGMSEACVAGGGLEGSERVQR